MTKYIIVTGGVISGLGKGITASAIGMIFKMFGFTVSAIKIDPYLNETSDTMSPFEHGEAYVLEDGSVTDLDLGNYERFLNIKLSKDHSLTSGKVMREILDRERRGDYLGKTVQIVPHATDYIQDFIENTSKIKVDDNQKEVDIVIVELGGTIGDIESAMYAEALSQFTRNRLDENEYCFVHVSLIPTIGSLDEVKTKPTQHSIKEVRRQGIYPDLLVLRCSKKLSDIDIEKVSRLCQIRKSNIIVNYDVSTIYDVPTLFMNENVHHSIAKKLNLTLNNIDTNSERFKWFDRVTKFYSDLRQNQHQNQHQDVNTIKIGIIGKYTGMQDTYLSLIRAIEMASIDLNVKTKIVWISSEIDVEDLTKEINSVNRIIIPGGFGIRGVEGMIQSVSIARQQNKKLLGICLGCQIIAIECARNLMGLYGANSSEFDKDTPHPIIVACADTNTLGGTMRLGSIQTKNVSKFSKNIYNQEYCNHRYRHRYVLNGNYVENIKKYYEIDNYTNIEKTETSEKSELIFNSELISGISSKDGKIFGVQYHPELSPRPDPIFKYLIN